MESMHESQEAWSRLQHLRFIPSSEFRVSFWLPRQRLHDGISDLVLLPLFSRPSPDFLVRLRSTHRKMEDRFYFHPSNIGFQHFNCSSFLFLNLFRARLGGPRCIFFIMCGLGYSSSLVPLDLFCSGFERSRCCGLFLWQQQSVSS